jgi:hypothetical protein
VLLAAGAAVMFLGDLLTVPLALAPLTAEPVPRIVLSCLRGGGWVEGAQYGVGMLGALLVEHQA